MEVFKFLCFDSGKKESPHKVLIFGYGFIDTSFHQLNLIDEKKNTNDSLVTVRIHSECFTGDVLCSLHCDCGSQLKKSIKYIVNKGSGILIFPSSHEGRGIGIVDKIRAYALQEELKVNTFEANRLLGHEDDARCYSDINEILNILGVNQIELLTDNPSKILELKDKVVTHTPIVVLPNIHNSSYLKDKKDYFTLNNKPSDIESFSDMEKSKDINILEKHTPILEIPKNKGNKTDLKIAIVYSAWHESYIIRIRNLLKMYLNKYGINNIVEYEVPGSNEIPFRALKIAKEYNGIICLGILIKGDTLHFENVSGAVSNGIMQAQISTGIPMMNVVLSCLNFQQVEERISGEKNTLEYIVQGLLCMV
jgi:GTP cyclohydrolase II